MAPRRKANPLFQQTGYLEELIISWVLLFISLPLCFYVLMGVRDTNYDVEHVTKVEDIPDGAIDGVAVPPGHVAGEHVRHGDNKAPADIEEGSTTASV